MRYWKETSITTAFVTKAIRIVDEDGNVIIVKPGESALLTSDYVENEGDEPSFAFGEDRELLVKFSEAEDATDSFLIGWTHGFPVDAQPQEILPWNSHEN